MELRFEKSIVDFYESIQWMNTISLSRSTMINFEGT